MREKDFKPLIDKIVEDYKGEEDPDLVILQEVQSELGYIGEEQMKYVSKKTGIPLTKLYGITTFYPSLKLNPPGRNTIKICQGTACHVRGGAAVQKELEKNLKIKPNETTEDRRFSLEVVRCLGCCGLSPVIMINDETFGRVKPAKIGEILSKFE